MSGQRFSIDDRRHWGRIDMEEIVCRDERTFGVLFACST